MARPNISVASPNSPWAFWCSWCSFSRISCACVRSASLLPMALCNSWSLEVETSISPRWENTEGTLKKNIFMKQIKTTHIISTLTSHPEIEIRTKNTTLITYIFTFFYIHIRTCWTHIMNIFDHPRHYWSWQWWPWAAPQSSLRPWCRSPSHVAHESRTCLERASDDKDGYLFI